MSELERKFCRSTSVAEASSGVVLRLSPSVRALGYSGCPITLDEFWKLQQIIESTPTLVGSKRGNLPPVITSCAQCGVASVRHAADIRKHKKRGLTEFYCSNACWGKSENLRRHGERSCLRCGTHAPKANAEFGSPGRIFCSPECLAAERQEELEQRVLERLRPCDRCNAMFLPFNAQSRFCSRDCASRAHSGAMRGESNPRWTGGVSQERTKPHVTRRYREMRPFVMNRDGNRCMLCAGVDGLEVHHIDENPMNNRAVNLVTVCRPCHHKVHFSEQKAELSLRLKTHAETPLSTTSKWRKPAASSPTASSPTTAS